MAPKRVAYVITDSGTGGAENKLSDILKNLNRSKVIPVGVIVLKHKREVAFDWERLNVPVYELGMSRWPTPWAIGRLKKKLNELSPDVVHSLTMHSVLLSRIVRRRSSFYKLVSAPCLNFRTQPFFIKALLRLTSNWDDAIICESTATRRFLVENAGHSPNKALYVPNSIDTQRIIFSDDGRRSVRQEWGVGPSEIVVGTVGRLHAQKGFDVFIEALALLKSGPAKLRGVVVGEGSDRAFLEKRVKEKNVSVQFVGRRTDIMNVMSAFDIYVQSSRYEGMSRALMEAMGVGCPIVATAVDGTMDLSKDGINMLLCRTEDPSSLALAIATLAEKSDLRKKISLNARSTIEQYDVGKMLRQLEDIYQG